MAKIGLEIPEELVDALRLPRQEIPERLKRELALRLYEKGFLGFGKARQLAGATKWEFSALLAQEGICRHYDEEELERDLETLKGLG